MRDGKKTQIGSTLQWGLAVVLAIVLPNIPAVGQAAQIPTSASPSHGPLAQAAAPPSRRLLIVSIPDRKLVLLQDGEVKRVYPVAVGKTSTPSPSGHFTIARRVSDPTYSHHGKFVPAGPRNPVGSRWMGLSEKGYGIHGTNEPNSVGKAASHGCIRMGKSDVEELFALVQVGDVVEIRAQHDDAVAMALGAGLPVFPAPPAPVVVAKTRLLLAGNADAPRGAAIQNSSRQ